MSEKAKKLGVRATMVAEAVARLNAAGIDARAFMTGHCVCVLNVKIKAPAKTGGRWMSATHGSKGHGDASFDVAISKIVAMEAAHAACSAKVHHHGREANRLKRLAMDLGDLLAKVHAMHTGDAP